MVSKKIVFIMFLIVSFGPEGIAQTRLSYGDTTGPFQDFPSNLAIDSHGDSVIIGYGERFDLPPGKEVLDSVDFIIDSLGADSNIIDMVPVMTVMSSKGPELLPDVLSHDTINNRRLNPVSINPVPGTRSSLSCGKINVENSFFIVLINPRLGKGNTYRAIKQATAVDLDTARAALIVNYQEMPFVFTELVDGNLVPAGVNVDMDIGITYEGTDGVQVHLSPSSVSTTVWPNPALIGNTVRLSGVDSVISAEVVDEAGRIVHTYRANESNAITEIPTQGFSSGVYNVVLFHSDGTTSSVKFVVE